ncbi:hypothetical protein [Chondromyces crocatus]|uniref:hypothetical protein n=1 Tax=Chondromyces crocatus TaxID=52 RepID=UPI00067B1C87|nr:hypothetical protein [Chondromyces crocatus]
MEDRTALAGILLVLKPERHRQKLLQEMGLWSWDEELATLAGLVEPEGWAQLHHCLLDDFGQANVIDCQRASLDSAGVKTKGG